MLKFIGFLSILLLCNYNVYPQFKEVETIKQLNYQLHIPSVSEEPNNNLINNLYAINPELSKQLSYKTEKKRKGGFGRGVWIGALTGSVSGGIIGLVTYTPCEGLCILAPSSLGDSFAAGVIVGAISGAIIGGITGLVIKLTKKK